MDSEREAIMREIENAPDMLSMFATFRENVSGLFTEIDALRKQREGDTTKIAVLTSEKNVRIQEYEAMRTAIAEGLGLGGGVSWGAIMGCVEKLTSENVRLRAVNVNRHAGHCDGNCGMSIVECATAETERVDREAYGGASQQGDPFGRVSVAQWLYEQTYRPYVTHDTPAWAELHGKTRVAWQTEAQRLKEETQPHDVQDRAEPAPESDQGAPDGARTVLAHLDALRDVLGTMYGIRE